MLAHGSRQRRSWLIFDVSQMPDADPIDLAIRRFPLHRTFRHSDRTMTIACLVREADWRPLDAPWWRGKEVSIIGVDLDGNFFLRHSGGSVRFWDHRSQTETLVAPSVKGFVAALE